MAMEKAAVPGRLDRRKARTRAALVTSAREMLAREGGTDASIQEITERADVGLGSFYNHFASKAELFEAALADTLEEHGALLDEIAKGFDDPAEVFAMGLRLTLRLHRTHPQIAKIMQQRGFKYLLADNGLAPRAMRDLQAAADAGRLSIGDPQIALACTGGALLGASQLLAQSPEASAAGVADELAVNVLRMFGLPHDEAREVASRPLPQLWSADSTDRR